MMYEKLETFIDELLKVTSDMDITYAKDLIAGGTQITAAQLVGIRDKALVEIEALIERYAREVLGMVKSEDISRAEYREAFVRLMDKDGSVMSIEDIKAVLGGSS